MHARVGWVKWSAWKDSNLQMLVDSKRGWACDRPEAVSRCSLSRSIVLWLFQFAYTPISELLIIFSPICHELLHCRIYATTPVPTKGETRLAIAKRPLEQMLEGALEPENLVGKRVSAPPPYLPSVACHLGEPTDIPSWSVLFSLFLKYARQTDTSTK
jgi:hypothetical protein